MSTHRPRGEIVRLVLVVAPLAALAACAPAAATIAPASAPRGGAAITRADRAGIDAAIRDVYAAISGPAGRARDWAALRAMFTPDARLTFLTPKGLVSWTVEQYVAKAGPDLVLHGFTERELARRLEVYGDIAHAWSSYEGTTSDGSFHVRGINSFQLARGGDGRWRIQAIFWQPETPALPLPADMDAHR